MRQSGSGAMAATNPDARSIPAMRRSSSSPASPRIAKWPLSIAADTASSELSITTVGRPWRINLSGDVNPRSAVTADDNVVLQFAYFTVHASPPQKSAEVSRQQVLANHSKGVEDASDPENQQGNRKPASLVCKRADLRKADRGDSDYGHVQRIEPTPSFDHDVAYRPSRNYQREGDQHVDDPEFAFGTTEMTAAS